MSSLTLKPGTKRSYIVCSAALTLLVGALPFESCPASHPRPMNVVLERGLIHLLFGWSDLLEWLIILEKAWKGGDISMSGFAQNSFLSWWSIKLEMVNILVNTDGSHIEYVEGAQLRVRWQEISGPLVLAQEGKGPSGEEKSGWKRAWQISDSLQIYEARESYRMWSMWKFGTAASRWHGSRSIGIVGR